MNLDRLLDPANRLFALARLARRLPNIPLALVMAVVFVIGGEIVGGLIGAPIFLALGGVEVPAEMPPVPSALYQSALLIIGFAPIAGLIALWMARYEGRPFWTVGLERDGAGFKCLRGVAVGLGQFVATLLIWAALGYVGYEEGDPARQGWAALAGVLLVLIGWTVQGSVEEILCRGWLMPVVAVRSRPWVGVIVSSVFFTALHALNPNLSAVAILNLFLFGVFTALYALWEGGIWGACSQHAAWNWAQGNLFGIEVSGTVPGGGILFNLQETGPDLVTGGAFGAEGGLAVTAVLVVSTVLMVVLLLRRRHGPALSA